MMFASFGPAVICTLVAELDWKKMVSMNSAEEETQENESRGAGSNSNRILEEETKHFYEWDFSHLGLVACDRLEMQVLREMSTCSQHHPNIVIPPPKQA